MEKVTMLNDEGVLCHLIIRLNNELLSASMEDKRTRALQSRINLIERRLERLKEMQNGKGQSKSS